MNKFISLALVVITVMTFSFFTAGISSTDVYAKKNNDNGADVQKGFPCGVPDGNGGIEVT